MVLCRSELIEEVLVGGDQASRYVFCFDKFNYSGENKRKFCIFAFVFSTKQQKTFGIVKS